MKKHYNSREQLAHQLSGKTLVLALEEESVLKTILGESAKAFGLLIGISIGLTINMCLYHLTHGAFGFSI